MKSDFIKATSSLVGVTIGAGIFGVPYVIAQAGFLTGTILFVVLTLIMVLLHLMYAEVVERTKNSHRLIGYTKEYLGKKAKNFVSLSVIFGAYGSFVVYILIANEFFNTLFSWPGKGIFFWGVIFWAGISLGIVQGLKTISKFEIFMLALLVAVFGVIIARGLPLIQIKNLSELSLNKILLPYGVIFFSLGGFAAIPEMRSLIKKSSVVFKRSVISGVFISALITYVFALVVVGVSGSATSEEAISGLLPYLGNGIVYLGAVFGLLAIATSYLISGINLKEAFMFDWGMKKSWGDFLLVVLPIVLVFLGIRSFIAVIGIVGAVLGAINGSVITLLFIKAKKQGTKEPSFSLRIPNVIIVIILSALLLGGLYAIIKII